MLDVDYDLNEMNGGWGKERMGKEKEKRVRISRSRKGGLYSKLKSKIVA